MLQKAAVPPFHAISPVIRVTNLADESKGLPPHPFGTVAEPDGELIDEVQAQVIGPTGVQLLENLHNLSAHEEITQSIHFKVKVKEKKKCFKVVKNNMI